MSRSRESLPQVDTRSVTAGDVPDIGKAPTSRVYTRDYSKVGRDPEDTDLLTAALGRPIFRI